MSSRLPSGLVHFAERTVGAALHDRPSIEFHTGAATEGRPYSSMNEA